MNSNERALYKNYLIGLRKTRMYMNHSSIDTIKNVLDYTNDFTKNNSMSFGTSVNNTELNVKSIVIGNIVIDVSTVKSIHVSTNNQSITIELDRKSEDTKRVSYASIFGRLHNIDTMINTISFIGKIIG